MSAVSIPSRQKSWQAPRQRVSVLAELAIHKKTVVDKLASLREDHDLTQEKAAQAVGVTVRQWQRWESGASVPYPRNLDAIAARFGFDVSDFFTEGTPPASSSGDNGRSQLDRIETLLTEQAELLEENQRLLLAIADGLSPQQPSDDRPTGPPWAALDRLREELAARDRQASQLAHHTQTSSMG